MTQKGIVSLSSFNFARRRRFSRSPTVLAPSVCHHYARYHETNPLLFVPNREDLVRNADGNYYIHQDLASYLYVAVCRAENYAEVRVAFPFKHNSVLISPSPILLQRYFTTALDQHWRGSTVRRGILLNKIGISERVFSLYFNTPRFLDHIHDCFSYVGDADKLLMYIDHAIRIGLGLQAMIGRILRYDTASGDRFCPENQAEDVYHAGVCKHAIRLAVKNGERVLDCTDQLAWKDAALDRKDETLADLRREIAALNHELGIAKAHVSRLRQASPSLNISGLTLVPDTHWLSEFPDIQTPISDLSIDDDNIDTDSDSVSNISVFSDDYAPNGRPILD